MSSSSWIRRWSSSAASCSRAVGRVDDEDERLRDGYALRRIAQGAELRRIAQNCATRLRVREVVAPQRAQLSWPPTSTVNAMFLYSRVSTLKPIVGIVFFGLPSLRRYGRRLAARVEADHQYAHLALVEHAVDDPRELVHHPLLLQRVPHLPRPRAPRPRRRPPSSVDVDLLRRGGPAAAAGTAALRSIFAVGAVALFDFDAHLQ